MQHNTYGIYHHGIKGMRLGARRFQNNDGFLTPLVWYIRR
jgi:hypothetical protein